MDVCIQIYVYYFNIVSIYRVKFYDTYQNLPIINLSFVLIEEKKSFVTFQRGFFFYFLTGNIETVRERLI